MPLNDLLEVPFRTCETGSDRAPKHEGAHFTSNSLPDSPSGGKDRAAFRGIIRPKAKYPANRSGQTQMSSSQAINYLQGEGGGGGGGCGLV